jgi:hypothetical protein
MGRAGVSGVYSAGSRMDGEENGGGAGDWEVSAAEVITVNKLDKPAWMTHIGKLVVFFMSQ